MVIPWYFASRYYNSYNIVIFYSESSLHPCVDYLWNAESSVCCVPSAGMCVKCSGGVYGADQACQAMGHVYHDSCFTCCACGKTAAQVSVQMHGNIPHGWWHEYIHTKHISASSWHRTFVFHKNKLEEKSILLLHSPRNVIVKKGRCFLGDAIPLRGNAKLIRELNRT